MTKNLNAAAPFLLLLATTVCHAADLDQVTAGYKPSKTIISPGENAQFELQEALINAGPGDVIEISAGKYVFDTELNVVCNNVTIRGAGREKTVLSFKGQIAGSAGIQATGNAFVIEDLSVEDTAGNAIKVLGARDVTFRNVRVAWTDGPKSTNGAYGIYPVECQNVLIENCVSIAASDAGIYVGQCHDVIVKGCVATRNVAGIEIENTLRADVFDNVATDNTGGILIFDLPGLTVTNGGQVRIFRNKIENNNHKNFAPEGTMVADVPAGTGVMLMATDNVEIFDNDVSNHQTDNIVIVSFLITERKINDKKYDPFPEAFHIHDNRLSDAGKKPSGKLGMLLAPLAGLPFPDIFYDGIIDTKKLVDGKLPTNLASRIRDNGEATFGNFNVGNFSATNVLTGKYSIDRDLEPYNAERTPLDAVTLKPHEKSSKAGNPAVAVYRSAPRKLSEWGFLHESDNQWVAAENLIPYDLNTPLFSDYTVKHRHIRMPEGKSMTWNDEHALDFPVGTVIAKTFAYPDPSQDKTVGERFLETRVELHQESGWYGYSYIWNEQQTDADLKLGGGSVDVSWTDEAGEKHDNHYQVPNANQCLSCHSRDGKYQPLGPTARNLNGLHATDSGKPVNQLAHWVTNGLLKEAPAADDRPVLADFDDADSASLDKRARAWLEVNCAHCHAPHGSARTSGLDLRTTQVEPGKFGIFKSPVAAGKGSGGRRYDIVPGKPDESILMFRLETDIPGARMPNLARNLAHAESNDLIREWIEAMPVQENVK